MFLRKGVLKIGSKFPVEYTIQHGCSPANLLHISRTPLYKNTSGGLLLSFEILQLLGTWYYQSLVISHFSSVVAYHFGSVTLFIKAWIQVLPKFKSCSRRVGDLRWWRSLTNVPAGNKAKCLSSVNHSAKQFVIIVIIIIIIIDQMVLVLHMAQSSSW